MTAPWLPTTSSTKRLEKDLQERGWRIWWTARGTVKLRAPDGSWIEVDGHTQHQTMQNAYASAQEYANARTGHAIGDAYERGRGLGSVKA